MNYYGSGSVRVFPSSYRTQYTSGKFTSENNITNIIKSLIRTDDGSTSFVVGLFDSDTGKVPITTGTGMLKVIIDGYYFEIDGFELSGDKSLYIKEKVGYLVNYTKETRILDEDPGTSSMIFYGLGWSNSDESGYTEKLEVCKGGKLVNLGYISALCDDEGNWINISKIIIMPSGLIDPSSIDFNSIQNYIYVAKFIAERATQLGEWSSGTFSPYNKGGYNGGVTTTIRFADGVPTESIKITYSTNQPSGTANNGDIWFVY